MIPSKATNTDVAGSKLVGLMDGANVADPAAVTVSVELTEFAPGVTGDGDKEQVGAGAGPARAQLS